MLRSTPADNLTQPKMRSRSMPEATVISMVGRDWHSMSGSLDWGLGSGSGEGEHDEQRAEREHGTLRT